MSNGVEYSKDSVAVSLSATGPARYRSIDMVCFYSTPTARQESFLPVPAAASLNSMLFVAQHTNGLHEHLKLLLINTVSALLFG